MTHSAHRNRRDALVTQALWDQVWMRWAIAMAKLSERCGEVPVGAVVVAEGALVALGCNQPIGTDDPTAHAEIVALRAAARQRGNYRLPGTSLYVTIEPCAMCAGAIFHARVAAVVFGAPEPKTGVAGSQLDLFAHRALNPHTEVRGGVLRDACIAQLRHFFQLRRAQRKKRS